MPNTNELPPIEVGEKIKVRKAYVDKYPEEFTTNTWYAVTFVHGDGSVGVTGDNGAASVVDAGSIIRNTMLLKKKMATKEVSLNAEGVILGEPATVAEVEAIVEEINTPEETVEEPKTTAIAQHEVIGQDENKKVVELALKHNLPVLLIGETGTGKTSLVREQAINQGKELIRFSITGETTVDEFVGKYELEKGETVWKDGVLLDAMKNGKWLVADEINVALPEILFVLHSLLDDDRMITVSNHEGEVVKPHADFRFFATMNPPEEYAGTKELNKAFQSRFSIVLQVHYPEPEVEAKILTDKAGVPAQDAIKMVDVGNALRQAKNDDKIFYTCSTRDLLHWADVVSKGLHPNEAFKVAILNKTGQDHETVTKIYQTIIGDYVKLEKPELTLTIEWFKERAQKIEDDFASFEARKTEIREEITADIVKQLTNPTAHTVKPEEITDGIFKS